VHARTTLLEIDTLRISLDAAVEVFEVEVMPELRKQPGFLGVYGLSTPQGRAMLVSFWETEDQAEAGVETGWYPEVLAQYTTFFRTPPGREHYEVRFAEPPAVRSGTD
jgi:heme-degrading monooxygenase HmoA